MRARKKIKTTLVFLIVIIGIVSTMSYYFSKPIIINMEMKEYIEDSQKKRVDDNRYNTIFYQDKKSKELKKGFIKNEDGSVCDNNRTCYTNDQVKILSTQDNQDQLTEIFTREYQWYIKAGHLLIKYEDINSDGIEDLLLFQAKKPNNGTFYQYIFFYSAHNNEVLWEIEDRYDDFYQPLLDVRFIKNTHEPPAIVIFNEVSTPKYTFYKSTGGKYEEIVPNNEDWSNYWKAISPGTLIVNKVLGVWGFLTIIVIMFYLLLLITIVSMIVVTVKVAKYRRRIN